MYIQRRTVYIIKIDLPKEDTLYIMGYSCIYNKTILGFYHNNNKTTIHEVELRTFLLSVWPWNTRPSKRYAKMIDRLFVCSSFKQGIIYRLIYILKCFKSSILDLLYTNLILIVEGHTVMYYNSRWALIFGLWKIVVSFAIIPHLLLYSVTLRSFWLIVPVDSN